jgi:hypothetical protein
MCTYPAKFQNMRPLSGLGLRDCELLGRFRSGCVGFFDWGWKARR